MQTYIFKEKFIIFQNLPENVIILIFKSWVFKTTVLVGYMIKLSSYIKEQLKLHYFLGLERGLSKISPLGSTTFSRNNRK